MQLSIKKDQLAEMFACGFEASGGQLKTLRVRTADGKLMDFEDLVMIVDQPVALPKPPQSEKQ